MASINSAGALAEDKCIRNETVDIQQREPSKLRRFWITRSRERLWTTCIASLVASTPVMLMGFTLAFPSSALPELMGGWEEGSLPGKDYEFSTRLSDAFSALAQVGAIFGGPIGGWIADRWGRKCSLMFNGVPYLVGYLILSYAHYSSTATVFKTLLLTGRFISGVGMGWASNVASIYIGEIASSKLRGVFATTMQLFLGVGLLLCYSIASWDYYNGALVAVGIVALFELLMIWLIETPRWLVVAGDYHRAFRALQWLRGPEYDVNSELDIVKLSISNTDTTAVWREFKKKRVLVPFITLLIVCFFQQSGGLNALGAYGTIIFKEAGVANLHLTSVLSIGVSAIVAITVSFFIVDLMGRKPLLVISGMGTCIGSILLGLDFYLTRPSLCSGDSNSSSVMMDTRSNGDVCNPQYGPLAIVSISMYCFMFALGWGPVPWILLPELLPLKVRGFSGGLAALVNWGTSAVVGGTYLDLTKSLTLWGVWWMFAVINFISVVFVLLVLVETKGKNLENIQAEFVKKWKL